MATNAEMYKSEEERQKAFTDFCWSFGVHECNGCPLSKIEGRCFDNWLKLSADLNPLAPCPFCGSANVALCSEASCEGEKFWVKCRHCGASSAKLSQKTDAINAWNRRN